MSDARDELTKREENLRYTQPAKAEAATTYIDCDGDKFRAVRSVNGLIDLIVNGDEAVTFYASDAQHIIKLIEQAAS